MAIRTARHIVNSALRLIGISGRGFAISAEDAQNGLDTLNDMLDAWSVEELILPVESEIDIALSIGVRTYTVATIRSEIDAKIIDVNNNQYGFDIVSRIELERVNDPNLQARPYQGAFYTDSSFIRKVDIYPVPSVAETLRIWGMRPFSEYSGLTESMSFPPGYNLLLKYNLAILLATEYGRAVSPTILIRAEQMKNRLYTHNISLDTLAVDAALLFPGYDSYYGRYNINTD